VEDHDLEVGAHVQLAEEGGHRPTGRFRALERKQETVQRPGAVGRGVRGHDDDRLLG
jgi:hypothetical protein